MNTFYIHSLNLNDLKKLLTSSSHIHWAVWKWILLALKKKKASNTQLISQKTITPKIVSREWKLEISSMRNCGYTGSSTKQKDAFWSTSRPFLVRLASSCLLGCHVVDKINDTATVAKLIVIPGKNNKDCQVGIQVKLKLTSRI